MGRGNVGKLSSILLVLLDRRIPLAARPEFSRILKAPGYDTADRRLIWRRIGLINLVPSYKVEGIDDIDREAIFKLPDYTLIGGPNGATHNGVHNVGVVGGIRTITVPRLRPQIAYSSNIHEFIGRAAIKRRVFIADEPMEIGRLAPLPMSDQIGIMMIRSVPVKIRQLPAAWMPAHR